MKLDMILAGVGGQGILSIAFVLDNAALAQGVNFKQSEVHGMAQRGGAVMSHLRLSDGPIHSDLVPAGAADLILSVEPMEVQRYRDYLCDTGRIVTSTAPFVNIPNYPEPTQVVQALREFDNRVLLDADKVAKEAGNARCSNMVMLGAASPVFPLSRETMEQFIGELFRRKGEKLVAMNVKAFDFGLRNGAFFAACLENGMGDEAALRLMNRLSSETLDPAAAKPWAEVVASEKAAPLGAFLAEERDGLLPGDAELPRRVLAEGVDVLRDL